MFNRLLSFKYYTKTELSFGALATMYHTYILKEFYTMCTNDVASISVRKI